MSLLTSSKNNSCPVCENTSGKCRQGRNDPDYWQCMSYSDARKGEIVSGFKCIGHTKDRFWGQFKLDTSQEWSEQQRQDWHQENQRRRQKKVKEDEQRRRQSLSIEERNRQYRQMFSELSLHPDDRADLIRRGFSHQEIELSGFKSIERYQQLQSKFSTLLPGIGDGGRTLLVEGGYLCPVRNPDGLIVALQLRLRGINLNKYRWESSKTDKNPQGQSPHLYDWEVPELPLAVHYPAEARDSNRIGLTEGTGAKPFLASQRLGIPVIGAAGGQFPSSPNQLKAYLQQIGERLGTQQEIIPTLFPDAGAIQNKSVLNQIHKTVELLEKSGYRIEIAWWNQIEKAHLDIDELPLEQLTDIQYLSLAEFKAICKENRELIKPLQTPQQANSQLQNYSNSARIQWQKNRLFTVETKYRNDSEWCNWLLPPKDSIFFGKAGLGRGKTTNLKRWVELWNTSDEEIGFVCLGYRNSLLRQLCSPKNLGKFGFYHLREEDSQIMSSDPRGGLALCVDSLLKLSPEYFDNKIIILDEVKSVVKHLLYSPTIRNRDKVLERFTEAIRRARQVICLDGLMTDWVVQYLHALAPQKQTIKAENTYRDSKPVINFLLGTVDAFDDNKKPKVNDRSPWLKELLENSPVPAVCADSQILIEAVDILLSVKGLKVLRVDSKTVCEDNVRDFLEDCNTYIEQHRPDVLLYTPTAESGVDVSISDYFSHHFAFFFGVIDIDAMLQMLGRIRDSIPKFVWVKSFVSPDEKQHFKSPFADIIEKATKELFMSDINISLADTEAWNEKIANHLKLVLANSNNIHHTTNCLISSIQNYEKSNLRECLKEALEESGYLMNYCTLPDSSEHSKQAKETSELVKNQNSHDIFMAEKIPIDLIETYRFKERWEDRCKVIQARLRERLPGIDTTEIWSEELIYKFRYQERDFLDKQELYWLFKHPEVAKRLAQEKLHRIARSQRVFIGNLKSRWAKVNALLQIGLEKFLEPGWEWTDSSPEVIQLLKDCQKSDISVALGRSLGKQSGTRFIGSLLGLLGHKQKVRKDAEGNRHYSFDESTSVDPIREIVLECLDTKWQKYLVGEVEVLDWNAAVDEANGISPANQPQIHSEQAFEETARTLKNVYTKNDLPAVTEIESKSEDQGVIGDVVADAVMSSAEELAIAFSPDICPTAEDFALAVEAVELEIIEDAIALQDSAPRRNQLRTWLEALNNPPSELPAGDRPPDPSGELSEPDKSQIRAGSQVIVGRRGVLRCNWVDGLAGVVESVAGLGRCLVRFINGRIELFDDSDLLPLPSG